MQKSYLVPLLLFSLYLSLIARDITIETDVNWKKKSSSWI